MFLGLLLSAAVASIVGGRVSDRRGRKPLVYLAGGLMSAVGVLFIAYILLNTLPTPGPFMGAFNTVLYLGIGFGIGYGTYQAVDWALGTDVLPNKDTAAAKDLGVWHIAFVLPQSVATALAGWLLTLTAGAGLAAGPRYSLVFAMSIVYFVLGTLLVRNVRGAR
jgi:MFS family permease